MNEDLRSFYYEELNKQSVKLYFVDDLKKVKRKQVDLKDFPFLGKGVIHLNETIAS